MASARTGNDATRRIRVLQSFPRPRSTTNPYIHQLDSALAHTAGLEHVRFDRLRALFGRYDLIHFHWPETLFGGTSRAKMLARRAFAAALLLRLRLTRTPIVRTAHNVGLPSGLSAWERRMLEAIERRTAFRILLHPGTPVPRPDRTMVIPHGHYADWFGEVDRLPAVPDTLAFVGLIRRYKGVEHLIETFGRADDAGLRLAISGRPTSDELGAEVRRLADADPRVRLDLRYLSEPDFARAVMQAAGIVLPYRFMHNSGTTLAALSLDRPVLVPRTDVNEDLADEVGHQWVHLFDGDLTVDDLLHFRDAIATPSPTPPDLSGRDWARAGVDHRNAYLRALGERS